MLRSPGIGVVILCLMSGVLIVLFGISALQLVPKPQCFQTFQHALVLGGGLLITGLFALKSRWHGIIGGGVMALLGAATGISQLDEIAAWFSGNPHRHPAAPIEFGTTLICVLVLFRVLAALRRERTRRLLAEESDDA